MKRKINIIEAAMKYYQIVLAMVIVGVVLGIFGLMNMPRNEFPDFTIRQGLIVGIYPGASSQKVEEQLTEKVENYIFSYAEVNKEKTYSESKEGKMFIYVELNDDVHNSDKFWSKLRHGLDELKMQLPTGVLALVGTNDFGDTSALLISLSSDQKSYRELEDVMKDLKNDIRKIPSVSKIKTYGQQKEKVFVYVEPEKLNEYHIQPTQIFTAFQLQDAINYAGDLDNGEMVLPVHLNAKFNSVKDIEDQIIFADPDGNIIRMKDIAHVEKKYEEAENYIRNNQNPSLLISLEMQKGNNIVQFGEEVQNTISKFRETQDADVEINVISNQPEVVHHSISHFLREFIIAILSVILVTMFLLPFRVSSVAAITIPISILITMGIMQLLGIQLDIVSLAGLIVVLGMVVDNAIVVIDNHLEQLDQGLSPWNAAWKAATELFIPVLSATAAIIAAFMPLMIFLKGMAGDFVGSFPVTIAIALIISMFVAVFLVPFISYVFIKKGLHQRAQKRKRASLLDVVQKFYDKGLNLAFKYPKSTLLIGFSTVIIALILFRSTDQKMFPTLDRAQFAVEVYLPEGSSIKQTEKMIDTLENILLKDERITNVASFIGTGSPRFHTVYTPHMPAKNYGQILVNTKSIEITEEVLDEYDAKYRNAFPGAKVKWKQLAMEKFTAPIEIRISGDNIKELHQSAEKVKDILQKNEHITWVRDSWLEKRPGININLEEAKAMQLGYTNTMVNTSLMTALNGMPITTIWEDDYPIDVMLIEKDEDRDEIQDLNDQYITSFLTMNSLPLRTIGEIEPEWTEGAICHRNGVRTITILADVERNQIYSKVLAQVKPELDHLELYKGQELSYGGEVEQMIQNYIPMGYSLAISLVLIFFILLFQFKTSRRALVIMSTMLLSLFGAVLGLKLVGYPFSLTAFIGVIGLMGITVRNGIILVDYAMHLVTKEGYSFKDAAIQAGKRRMRPIFLTSMAAAMGVVPMILSASPLWGPLGTVICFGLIFGMIITLYVLPVLYWKTTGKNSLPQTVNAE